MPGEGDGEPTTPGRANLFQRAAAIFEDARHLEPDAREALLEERAAGDATLLAAVRRLLEHADAPDSALREGISREAASLFLDAPVRVDSLAESQRVGGYRIVRLIGEGGMGTVYEAEQESPRRRVALKFLRVQHGPADELRRRFRREAEVLGRLDHPGIARIIEAGMAEVGGGEPQPFFAMELVRGLPLLRHAEQSSLSTRDRMELVARICDAVEHAHRLGVIHRDLKPDNIFVGSDGQPKVLDFGIAKLTDADLRAATVRTTAGDILGTVPYMSPEQVSGRTEDIDERTDVHALGVLAFELVSGRRPYRLQGLPLPAAARVIQEDEPTRLGELQSGWRGDVETIIGKALEKSRERRYASAADMAADIRRYLQHYPIEARAPSARYRAVMFARRNKAIVAGVAGIIVALALGVVFTSIYALQAARERDLARKSESQALHQVYRASLAAAQAALRDGEASARPHLDAAPEALRGWEWNVLHEQLDRSVFSFASAQQGTVAALALGAEGATLSTVITGDDGRRVLTVQSLDAGALLRSSELSDRPVRLRPEDLDLARRHATFAAGERDIPYIDSATGMGLSMDRRCGDAAEAAAVDALSGDLALVGGLACDLRTGRTISRIGRARAAALSPDGDLIALAAAQNLSIHDVKTGRCLATVTDGQDDLRGVFFVLGGTRIATVSWNGFLRLWDPHDFRLVEKHVMSSSLLLNAVVTPDGSTVAASGADPRIRVWNLRAGREVGAYYSTGGSLAFSDDGRRLAARDDSGRVQVFDLSGDADTSVLRGHESFVYPVVFDRDGARIYSGSWDGTIRAWDAETSEAIATLRAPTRIQALSLSPDGGRIVGSEESGGAVWDTATGRMLASSSEAGWLAWTPDSRLRGRLEGRPESGRRVLLDPDTMRVLPGVDRPDRGGVPSPDRAWSVHGRLKGELVVRSARDGSDARRLESLPKGESFRDVAWSPGGSRLVATAGMRMLAWDVPSWRKIADVEAHARRVGAVAFSPDGRLLASGGGDSVVRVWSVETMEPLLELHGHSAYVWAVAWSPDGTQLVSSSGDGTVRVWDSVPLRERFKAREERRRDMVAVGPVIERMFAELGDAERVVKAVREKYAGDDEGGRRLRRAALDAALQASLGRER